MATATRRRKRQRQYVTNLIDESGMVICGAHSEQEALREAERLERLAGPKPEGLCWRITCMGFPDTWVLEVCWQHGTAERKDVAAWLAKTERKAFP